MAEKFVTAAGVALRISDSGEPRGGGEYGGTCERNAPVIVLLHGYLESLDIWDDFTKLLKPHMRVVALDLPGHGISEVRGEIHTMEFLADVVHGVVEQCGVSRCIVCGHSMGGYVALEFLRQYPETTAGIILFHSTPNADTSEKREVRRREIEIVLAGKKELLAPTAAKSFAPENRRKFATAIAELEDQVYLTDDDGAVALLRGMEVRRDNNAVMAEISVPQLFIFGRSDEYITPEIAADMIARHPAARIVWLEHSGHIGFVEEPAVAAEALIGFCTEVVNE